MIQMPAHIRKMFSDTEKMLNEAMRIDEFQQGLCSLAIQFQVPLIFVIFQAISMKK